ncbi:piggyBac transposable element-derived protein 4-like [Melanaphis sacchari]|uniref:piggyBac transposable element-derived protein 4-like n=1 Tax=Melanaphis sacchari TaxID=742174 RepID=UPI000DC14664|nr:piggyBac transposable element-derived protein 4-like [Melanaphis sacchari]
MVTQYNTGYCFLANPRTSRSSRTISKPIQQAIPSFEPPNTPPLWGKLELMPSVQLFSNDLSCGPAKIFEELEDISPYNIFCQMFDKNLIDHIVFQTNLYATQIGKPFTPTYDGEIRVFIGLNMCMSVKRLPSYRDYWSSAPDLHDKNISSMMNVKRFSWLLSHIHFNNNQLQPKRGEDNYDKLYKIRPLLDYIGQNFLNLYRPHRGVAVDEAMVKFKGRSSLKQYMIDKPVKRGYKVWILSDSSGYNLKFEVYTGKKEGTIEAGLGGRVVLDLCKELENKNHVVYMDNFFSSNILFEKLLTKKIYACGTVRSNRKFLPTLTRDN